MMLLISPASRKRINATVGAVYDRPVSLSRDIVVGQRRPYSSDFFLQVVVYTPAHLLTKPAGLHIFHE